MARGDTYGAGVSSLKEWVGRLRSTGEAIRESTDALAQICKNQIDANIAAAIDPDGAAWAPLKEGGRALAGAASAVSAKGTGDQILLILEGKYVYHQYGTRHHVARRILPSGGLPDRLGNAIRKGLVSMVGMHWLKGGRTRA